MSSVFLTIGSSPASKDRFIVISVPHQWFLTASKDRFIVSVPGPYQQVKPDSLSSVFLTSGSSPVSKARFIVISVPHQWFLTSKQSQNNCHQYSSQLVPHQQVKRDSLSPVFLTLTSKQSQIHCHQCSSSQVPHQQIKPDSWFSVFLTNDSSQQVKPDSLSSVFLISKQTQLNCHRCSSQLVPHQQVKIH